MNKISSILFFFGISSCHSLWSQDSLFIKESEPLLVRVLEISATEVSYKLYFNPDGIIYKVANSRIEKIVYENGKVESRFQIAKKTTAPVNGYRPGMFIIDDNHISLDNRDITHKQAFKVLLKRDPQVNSDELNMLLLDVEGKRNAQIGFTIAGPVLFLGSSYLGIRRYYGPNDKSMLRNFVLTGASLLVASEITALIYKSVKNRKIRKAAKLYNKEISFD
jgi:hypothetical protein